MPEQEVREEAEGHPTREDCVKKRERLWKGSSNIGNDKRTDSERFGWEKAGVVSYMLISIPSYTNFPLND